MLPNRFSLTKKSEEWLKREKQKTGLSPNLRARELFFLSIEHGRLDVEKDIELGSMNLEKTVWLGDCQKAAESILARHYPNLSAQELATYWALHVEHGLEITSKNTANR